MRQGLVLSMLLAVMLLAQSALGDVPHYISYQGRLTNADGTPVKDSTYTIGFIINSYFQQGAWAETQSNVPVKDGLFSVLLGSVNPIPNAIFDGLNHFGYLSWSLDIVFNGDTIVGAGYFSSAPFSYRVNSIDNAYGGAVKGGLRSMDADGSTQVGYLGPDVQEGGVLELRSPFETLIMDYPSVRLSAHPYANQADFNLFLANDSTNQILGAQLHYYGDQSVTLPDNAVSSREISNEPGIAANVSSGKTWLDLNTMKDLITVSITIPDSGYIVLNGKAGEIDLSGTKGEIAAVIQIDETAGGTAEPSTGAVAAVGAGAFLDSTKWTYLSAATQRVYRKGPGTYTFRLEGCRGGVSYAQVGVSYPYLTAAYYKTGYGSVSVPVPPQEAGQFEQATLVPPSDPPASGLVAAPSYQVDLRELELKAARAEAEALRAQQELMRAKMAEQAAKLRSQEEQVSIRK